MYTSDEYRGYFVPWVSEVQLHTEFNMEGQPEQISDNLYSFPGDLAYEEISDTIQFTEPSLNGEMVEWSINYPAYPIWGSVQDEEEYYISAWDNPYSASSPGDFGYGFEFGITDNMAYLDLTSHIPRISNSSFFDLVQGFSLAVPHYTYFLSSTDLSKATNPILTVPSNLFQFEMDGTTVAEITMEEDTKKFYSLMDYPNPGENRTCQGIGSTVSGMITSNLFGNPHASRNWFMDTIFALKDLDIVKQDPDFANPDSLFDIQLQNYPLWSGYEIVHDPRFAIYFNTNDLSVPNQIPGFFIPVLLGVAFIMALQKYKKIHFSLNKNNL